jgi:DNA-binding IclR family transcriptional regulator
MLKAASNKISGEKMPAGGVEAVDRALSILLCFDDRHAALTLSAIAERTGLYKSTILRLAASLEASGFLARRPDKRFVLGHELMRLGVVYQSSFRLEDHVRPTLKRLLAATGESASFFIREGNRRVCLLREESNHSIRDHVNEGDYLSLDSGAASHVLKQPAWVSALPHKSPPARAPVFSFGERDPDTAAGAAPIFGDIGDGMALLGALTVSGPLTRSTPDVVPAMTAELLAESRKLSALLGGEEVWRSLISAD